MPFTHDLIVLGGGSAGLSLTSVAARMGVKVALVDKENLGGDCLHYGCVPSKTLIQSAKIVHLAKNGKKYGITANGIAVDFAGVMQRVRDVVGIIQTHAENAGVAFDERGYVKTDARLRTSWKHISAAGDVTGHLQFTHSASYEAGIIVSNALLHLPTKINLDAIPWTTFTDPEVASVGLNETRAKAKGVPYKTTIFRFDHQDRALAEGENHGFIKLLLGSKDRILGCQIVGPHAGELIHGWIVARNAGIPLKKLARFVHVYPTLAMANQQAAGEYLGGKFFTPRTRWWIRKIFGYRNTKIDEANLV